MAIEVTLLLGIIGSFVGLAGFLVSFLSNRDKKIINDSEWKGRIDAKLDIAIGIREEVEEIKCEQRGQGERLAVVEESTKSAHKRIDEICKK
ncbi:MAG: hypothetical protein VB081_10475 [Christensenella sp.]|uniref:hypothetical protein n=1 Tax=Christensenella sp. TaxID=1935934 RepID=UPI002B206A9A|nr:hypothetical protein [Christensenella sp.]MEA5003911.1 hypothetical protein [Christensenella sp.]